MKLDNGFGLVCAIDGRPVQEYVHDEAVFFAGVPGKRYTLRIFLPKGDRYGVRLTVDGKLAYGRSSTDAPDGIDMKNPNNETENELPGFYADSKFAGHFMFARQQPGQSVSGQVGTIHIEFYRDASGVPYTGLRRAAGDDNTRGASRGASRGCDLHTEADTSETAEIQGDSNLSVYKPGELIGSITLNYASLDYLRELGVAS